MALVYSRPNPPLTGDGVLKQWIVRNKPGDSGHSLAIDEDWASKDTADYVTGVNIAVTDAYKIAAGIPGGTTGTIRDFRYYFYYTSAGVGQIPWLSFTITLDGVQKGEIKEIQLGDETLDSKMVHWSSEDSTPFVVDCEEWYAGNRLMSVKFNPSGGGSKPPPDEPTFEE
jgi:hypothetical protein